ncbi:hypothetical protein BV20DRAFT_1000390 [Pilatotrama ljubarskyi]|nr:hypothetical protein BV20DRAFT_1000390 [Pilatotrama ljubarskyi]
MSDPLPLSPSFESIATAPHSSLDPPPTPKVRFDQDCILIPDPLPTPRLPRLVTKSYSLPLWKRKQREQSVLSDSDDDPSPDDHVVFKLSVPSLTTRLRSPSRADSAAPRPLVPCIVHPAHPPPATASSSSLSSSPRPTRPRGASLPQPLQSDAVTVPLRACCTQCYPSIDQCMKEGDHWKVRFSKGAARRRKSVSDARAPAPSPSARHCVKDAMPGFDAVIAVDEVDRRRRRSTDFDPLTAFTLEMPSSRTTESDDIPLRRALSLPGETHPMRAPAVSSIFPAPRTAAPSIPEEDEHRPSPRRTPIPSPFGSSTNIPATCIVHAAVHTTLVHRLASPSPSHSPPIAAPVPNTVPEKAALETPLPASPPPLEKEVSNYFSVPYEPSPSMHDRYLSDSPVSSPSSSPRIEHTTPPALGGQRKRSLRHIPGPGSLIREATQMLKGMSGLGGMAMTV